MWHPDGWDVHVRLGVLTPHADVGPESELRAMAPPGVGLHAARVPFAAMRRGGAVVRGGGEDPTVALASVRAFAEPPGVDDAVELLAAAPVSAIAYAFTSSAYVIGGRAEAHMVGRLGERAHGLPVVTSCLATVEALRVLGVGRICLIDPPWFDGTLSDLGRGYYEDAGFEVPYAAPCGLPDGRDGQDGQGLVRPGDLYEWVVPRVPDEAEAVVIGGNGFRSVGAVEALEAALGRPVLTANQALLWSALRVAGAPTSGIVHYGRLFAAG
ncbi:maleate cis-trans isomerase [Streptomyces sp. NPDC047023]|uniref:maleate cis-trans isomerase family protein n=1 Tax=Streptomyces sp. NPDC047023 TaxID=3155139 RepID=UPI0033EA3AD1